MSAFPVLATGRPAFVDSFAGLLPCIVTAITGPSGRASSEQHVTVRLTADHGPYRKDEVLTHWALWVIPPRALRRHRFSTTIGFYTVQPDRSPA